MTESSHLSIWNAREDTSDAHDLNELYDMFSHGSILLCSAMNGATMSSQSSRMSALSHLSSFCSSVPCRNALSSFPQNIGNCSCSLRICHTASVREVRVSVMRRRCGAREVWSIVYDRVSSGADDGVTVGCCRTWKYGYHSDRDPIARSYITARMRAIPPVNCASFSSSAIPVVNALRHASCPFPERSPLCLRT